MRKGRKEETRDAADGLGLTKEERGDVVRTRARRRNEQRLENAGILKKKEEG